MHAFHFADSQGRNSVEVIAPLLHNNSARLEICYLGNNFCLLLRLQSNKWLLPVSLKFTQYIYVAIFFLPCVLMYELNHHDCITFTLNPFSYFPVFWKYFIFLSFMICFCFHISCLEHLLLAATYGEQSSKAKRYSRVKYLLLFSAKKTNRFLFRIVLCK